MRKSLAVVALLASFLAPVSVNARQGTQQANGLSGRLASHPLDISAGQVTLRLPGLAAKADYAVVADVEPGHAAVFGLGLLTVSVPQRGSREHPTITAVADFPASSITSSAGSVSLQGLGAQADKKLAVYLVLPRPVTVRIEVRGSTVATLTPADGFVLYDGKVIGTGHATLAAGMSALVLSGKVGDSTPSLKDMGNGLYVANAQAVAEHVVSSTMPDAAASGTAEVVTLVVSIDQSGYVTGVQATGGDPSLQAASKQALSRWRFSPFLVNGQAVRVNGKWWFWFRGGHVMSPLRR